jgi:2,3-bisphosphoglycerate-independent phosphoglycerate mutase
VVQLYKVIEGGCERGMKRVRVHALADGRDVQDGSSAKFFGELRDTLAQISDAKGVDACIASGGGRMKVTMDRYEVRTCMQHAGPPWLQ